MDILFLLKLFSLKFVIVFFGTKLLLFYKIPPALSFVPGEATTAVINNQQTRCMVVLSIWTALVLSYREKEVKAHSSQALIKRLVQLTGERCLDRIGT